MKLSSLRSMVWRIFQLHFMKYLLESIVNRNLVRRLLGKVRDGRKLSEDTNMSILVKCGTSCLSRGGVFQLRSSKTTTGKSTVKSPNISRTSTCINSRKLLRLIK
eukprot:snap_masked-scaffold_6-processed-gene-1.37-mRNA-1 protein AED:1.00 eAED:1.00 QI:0/0/0/0/1/1/2/0/104